MPGIVFVLMHLVIPQQDNESEAHRLPLPELAVYY